jgi:Phage integrase family
MEIIDNASAVTPRRSPWNKGKLIGPKPPLQPKHVWAIRIRLQLAGRTRDLALFNLAIDSKLRGCDVVRLRVEDVAPHVYAVDRATVRQSKTGLPVRFEITEQTRQAIDEHLAATQKGAGDFLFNGRSGKGRGLSTRQYARLLSEWIASIGLDPSLFGTHSLRRTKATLIYRRTGNLRAVQLLLGTPKWRAPSDTSASRLTMRSPSPSRSTSEHQGRAVTRCPPLIGRSLANSRIQGPTPKQMLQTSWRGGGSDCAGPCGGIHCQLNRVPIGRWRCGGRRGDPSASWRRS